MGAPALTPQPPPTDRGLLVFVIHQLLPSNVQSTPGICTTWATGVTAVSIPDCPSSPHVFGHYSALNIVWAYMFKKKLKKKKKISFINKTSVGVISTCAVSRATSSFHTCACWPAVMGHSDRCYQTLYHWFLSSLFPFVHLYSFETRGILWRGVPCSPYVIYFASSRFIRLRKEAQNLVKNLRAARRTRVECF